MAVEITVKAFLLSHIRAISPYFTVEIVVNTHNKDFLKPFGIDVPVTTIGIERKISILSDLKAITELYRLFRKKEYDIIHSVTPKAGLLSTLAGYFAGIPIRIHIFTGQVWATKRGIKRLFLKFMDKLISTCATHILVDSPSQRDFIIREGVVSAAKAEVIGNGSICGVDADRFTQNEEARKEIRKRLSIAESDIVFFYLGRLNREKGLLILAESFSRISHDFSNARLVMVGPDEEDITQSILSVCGNCSEKIHFIGYAAEPERFMAAADVFCLPSHREGFGLAIIEAGAMGIPSIGSRVYGITDAIEDGVTGFLFNAGDVEDLKVKMIKLIQNPGLIRAMGEKARQMAVTRYSKEKVVSSMLDYYKRLAGLA